MKVLLHICCVGCLIKTFSFLRERNYDIVGFFYNPNIHPLSENKRRCEEVRKFSQKHNLHVIFNQDYDIKSFLQGVVFREEKRCFFCYNLRLKETAKLTKTLSRQAFTTTLLISPYQKHDLIKQIGESVASECTVEFIYYDLRDYFKESWGIAKKEGYYLQNYCGCIYSEAL